MGGLTGGGFLSVPYREIDMCFRLVTSDLDNVGRSRCASILVTRDRRCIRSFAVDRGGKPCIRGNPRIGIIFPFIEKP